MDFYAIYVNWFVYLDASICVCCLSYIYVFKKNGEWGVPW